MNPSHAHLLQMQALREALERAARAIGLAEDHTVRALSELQTERMRARELKAEVSKLNQTNASLLLENRRMRNLVGQACQDRHSLSAELQALLLELRDPTTPEPEPRAAASFRQRNAA